MVDNHDLGGDRSAVAGNAESRPPAGEGSGSRYRVIFHRSVTVSFEDFKREFPEEWADAQRRGIDEDGFTVESIRECDFETLEDIGSNPTGDFDWEPA